MIKILFLILALAAVGLTFYYGAFYQVSTPGATYHDTYTWLTIGAAIIFGGLFYASMVNREKSETTMLFD